MIDQKTYSIRMPATAVEKLKKLAEMKYLPPTAMARAWLLERLEVELSNEKPATGAEFGDQTPIAGGTQSRKGEGARAT